MKRVLFLAAVALVAFAGVAYAAGSITGKSIKDNTITGKDVKNKSLTPKDFRGSVRGPRGFTGAQGPAGPTGPAGPSVVGQVTVVRSAQVPFGSASVVQSAVAVCPAGQRVVSGGGASISDEELAATDVSNDRTSWFVIGVDEFDNGGEYVQATALCAPTGQAVAASNSRAKVRAQVDRLAEKIAAGRSRK
jgi:hypothetical protein